MMTRTITDHGPGSKLIVEQDHNMTTSLRTFIEKDMILYKGYHKPARIHLEVGLNLENQQQVESLHRGYLW